MKTSKEYPATHSMYTAWYVADEDGNVGIVDFNDNGPVPWETEETSVEDLVYGHEEDYANKEFLPIALTDEQIDDLMDNPHSPEEEEFWYCVVQIDLEKEELFLSLAANPDFEIEFCISKARGLYLVDAYRSTSDTKVHGRYPVLESSSLKKMLVQGVILKVYDKKDFWMNDVWIDDKLVYKKNFSSAPYYLFHQPYWVEKLPECMNVPRCPVKLEQIPEKLRERVLRLPVKFKETKSFQIAEWYPSAATGVSTRAERIGDCEYELLPLTDGTQAYICTSIISPYCFSDEKWDNMYYTRYDHCFTNRPTILVVMHPLEKWDYSRQTHSDSLMLRSAWVPFIPQIPNSFKIGPSDGYSYDLGNYSSAEEINKHVDRQKLLNLFQKNRHWLEDLVARFKPRVIMVSDMAKPFLESIYSLEKHLIEIAGDRYAFYLVSEVEGCRKEIEKLAFMPYRGEQIPYIISVEEMKKIKKQND